jgi:mycothiol system anti-sigma-R factor
VSCDLTQRFVSGYLDGELDLVRTIEVEAHLKSCEFCARELENQQALREALRRSSLAYAAPASLRNRIQASLDAATAPAPPTEIPEKLSAWQGFQIWRWAAAFAVLVVCSFTAWQLLPGLRGRSSNQQLAAEVFASHVRSLEANHLVDVVSTDQHTVKPWFDGKLDFAPPVEDLASDGFPLIGGRLDYLQGREVAALVYQRRKHFINLFVWPDASGSNTRPAMESMQGYNLLRWSRGGFHFWAASDVSAGDLEEFVRLLDARLSPGSK